MLSKFITSFRAKQYQKQHTKIVSQLENIEWDREQAFLSMKEALTSIVAACHKDNVFELEEAVAQEYLYKLTDDADAWNQLREKFEGADADTPEMYVQNLELNAVKLDEGVCLCSDDLSGKTDVVFIASAGDKSRLYTCQFIWEKKKWRCQSIV